jgi:hypothetical protein
MSALEKIKKLIKEQRRAQLLYTSSLLATPGCFQLEERRKFRGLFDRVTDKLKGVVPDIEGAGLLTAQNPLRWRRDSLSRPASEEGEAAYNKRANHDLEEDLRSRGFAFWRVGGKFGGDPEESYLVKNINADDLEMLSRKYDQEAFIHVRFVNIGRYPRQGEEAHGPVCADQYEAHFTYYDVDYENPMGALPVETRTRVFCGEDVQAREDFYSEAGGKKFSIPFFAEEEETLVKSV